MKAATLPSPGKYSNSQQLRQSAATAISACEIVAAKTVGGKTTSAGTLRTFFTACATALNDLYDNTAPTFASAVVANATPTKLEITLSEALDTGVVPAAAAFTISPAKTISTVEVVGTKVTLTVSAAFVNGNVITVAYAKPATNALRDPAGNQVATFTAQAVTNNVA